MVAQAKRMSLAEFMALPNDGNRHELVRGELRVMPPPKGEHGLIEAAIIEAIGLYLGAKARGLGWEVRQGRRARETLVGFVAGGEFGARFEVPGDPHQVRGVDGVYVPPDQLARVSWDRTDYFPAVPTLVIEVVSQSDRADDIAEGVQDYLAGGARRIWYVYPERRMIQIYSPDAPIRFVRNEGELTDEELLPGFALPLNMIFREPGE